MSVAPAFDAQRPPDPRLIADCVHCGFCLPACPTYLLWGEEMDSPRGRIHLMKQGHEGMPLSAAFARHVDLCLGCLGCVTACPSGVRYGQLIESTRQQVERRHRRTLADRAFRALLFGVLPHPGRLRFARAALRAATALRLVALARSRAVARLLPPRLAALASLAPEPRRPEPLPAAMPAQAPERRRVALLTGCVQRVFFPHVNAATARVLAAEGCTVAVPARQGCCGALSLHAGREAEARALARRTLEAFQARPCDAVVVNSAGCGSAMKAYPYLLRDDPEYRGLAESFSANVRDLAELLGEIGPRAPRRPWPISVAYHDACHLSHGQGIRRQPRELLKAIPGLELRELQEAEICCGSAGVYNLVEPEAGRELGDRKAAHLLASGAQAIVSSNPGCLLQLRAAIRRAGRSLPILHLAEALDASLQGRVPAGAGPGGRV
jgi:glycolate oxidase iron-sulfur subunit